MYHQTSRQLSNSHVLARAVEAGVPQTLVDSALLYQSVMRSTATRACWMPSPPALAEARFGAGQGTSDLESCEYTGPG